MKLPIPQDWDGSSWCEWAICWPDSENWRAILRGFITLPQRGRTWDDRTGTITEVQSIGREITLRNLPERFCIMACDQIDFPSFVTSMNNIAAALRQLAEAQCCSDLQIDVHAGGQGQVTQPSGEIVPIYGSQPPLAMPPGEFPPSYPDEDAYLADKCKKAHMIIDGLISSLTNIAGFGTINAVILAGMIAAAMAFGIIFPPALIPITISVLLIISGSLVLVAQLNAQIIENRDELICILYSHDSTGAIISTIADFLDIIIASLTPVGRLAYALKTLVLLIINGDTLNQLFDESVGMGNAEADCSACIDCRPIQWEFIEGGTEGWAVTVDMPECFGLDNPASGSIAIIDEKLVVTCAPQDVYHTGAIRVTDIEFDAVPGWEFLIRLHKSLSTSSYIDIVYLTQDNLCAWHTLDNDFQDETFVNITNNDAALDNKTIVGIYIYFRSSPEASGLQMTIEHMRLLCP